MTVERITSNRWQGLSTDTKPTTGVIVNSTFIETNTNTDWIYDGTLWNIKDAWVGPFAKKQGAHYPRGNITTSTGGCLGGLNSNCISGTGIVTGTVADTNGFGTVLDSGATTAGISGFKTTTFTERLYNCTLSYRFKLVQTAGQRMFMGWSSGTGSNPASNSDYLNVLSGVGLWFDDAVSANWKVMNNDGTGASTITDTSTAADTSVHTLSVTASQTPNFVVALDGATMTNGTVTTDMPASTTIMGTIIYIESTSSGSKTMNYYKLFVQSDL